MNFAEAMEAVVNNKRVIRKSNSVSLWLDPTWFISINGTRKRVNFSREDIMADDWEIVKPVCFGDAIKAAWCGKVIRRDEKPLLWCVDGELIHVDGDARYVFDIQDYLAKDWKILDGLDGGES